MVHFKCAACGARVRRDRTADGNAGGPCPSCGGPLGSALRAEEVLGLPVASTPPDGREAIAEYVRATIARNDAARRKRLH